jgi:predicted DNA-binding protein
MYTYIVQRTQIYLSERETEALDREARATGKTRSLLIREAIANRYGPEADITSVEAALRATAGAWRRRRQSGASVVDARRSGRLARLHLDP